MSADLVDRGDMWTPVRAVDAAGVEHNIWIQHLALRSANIRKTPVGSMLELDSLTVADGTTTPEAGTLLAGKVRRVRTF